MRMMLLRFVLYFVLLGAALTVVRSGEVEQANPSGVELADRIEGSPTLPFRELRLSLHGLPSGWTVGAVSGVAVGNNGDVYVIQRGSNADPILVFDKCGKLLRSWGRRDFTLPHSLRVDASGDVWAVDAEASKVIKYSPMGKKLLTIAVAPVPDTGGPFRGATDTAVAYNGHVYVSDGYGNARVVEYTTHGKEIRHWGTHGTAPTEFHLPHAIQISSDGVIYVADRENGRIQKFDLSGRLLAVIGGLGRCYSLKLDRGVLWASTSPMEAEPGSPGWLVKLDPVSGKLLGHVDLPEQHVGHSIDVLPSGEPVVTVGDSVVIFRWQKAR